MRKHRCLLGFWLEQLEKQNCHLLRWRTQRQVQETQFQSEHGKFEWRWVICSQIDELEFRGEGQAGRYKYRSEYHLVIFGIR